MQFKYILIALASQCALGTALNTYTLLDGTPIDADASRLVPASKPDDSSVGVATDSGPVSPKMLFARSCYPEYPVPCQNGNRCCYRGNECCENRSCINPNTQNCCLYGYYCQKPDRCIKDSNGGILCLSP